MLKIDSGIDPVVLPLPGHRGQQDRQRGGQKGEIDEKTQDIEQNGNEGEKKREKIAILSE